MKKANQKVTAHFIANTHLDREWTMDFRHTQKLTVEFMDNLIDVMEQVPEYHFLLDSQTVPLEDYLEIRPEKKPDLIRLIKSRRIDVGPWYSALDMNCLSGESITRNMLFGHKTAEQFGPVMKVGYTPFGWGQVSQLPQIYKEFGIDCCIFYRGVTPKQTPKSEFLWQGVDGTTMLCSRLGAGGRGAFYFFVWRQAFYKGQKSRLSRDLDWKLEHSQGPFKICDQDNRFDHGAILKPFKKLNEKNLGRSFRDMIELFQKTFTTSELPFMHGMDTTMSDIMEDAILRKCQESLKDGETFVHSSLPRYVQALSKAVNREELTTFTGEAKFYEIFEGELGVANDIISCRTRQKQLTTKAGNLLERASEPFAAMAHLLGASWPEKYLVHYHNSNLG